MSCVCQAGNTDCTDTGQYIALYDCQQVPLHLSLTFIFSPAAASVFHPYRGTSPPASPSVRPLSDSSCPAAP